MSVTGTRSARAALAVLLLVYAVLALRAAWVCDDAYISLRTVDNVVHGHGLTWNPPDRVQVYTHPLWLFLVTPCYALTGEAFHTMIVLGLAISILAVGWLAWRAARSAGLAVLAIAGLALSKAFTDYTTSGLENPLTHLLLLLFLMRYVGGRVTTRRDLFILSLLAALGALTRLDALLFYLPPLLLVFVDALRRPPVTEEGAAATPGGARWAVVAALAAGMGPLILWELFSLFYYGVPLPNTAYAKLNTGFPAATLAAQGLYYIEHTLRNDPLTLLLIAGGLLMPLLSRQRRHGTLAVGILLYLIYIVKIGGDFMGGRFLTAPLFVAVFLLAQAPPPHRRWLYAAGALLLVAGLGPRFSGWLQSAPARAERELIDVHGVADERAFYAREGHALFKPAHLPGKPQIFGEEQGRSLRGSGASVVLEGAVGRLGFHAGPEVHIVDIFGLADPLLARLPALTFDPSAAARRPHDNNWRIGHFLRAIPQGYLQSVMTGRNQLRDAQLGEIFEKLTLIVSGPLWSGDRLAEIWRFNTGAYRDAFDAGQYAGPVRIPLAQIAAGPEDESDDHSARALRVSFNGVQVTLPGVAHAPALQAQLDGHDNYLIVYYRDEEIVAAQPLAPRMPDARTLIRASIEVPPRAARRGYDQLGFFPLRGDGFCTVGGIRLIEQPS
jgi:arabinofuranosyltransferase